MMMKLILVLCVIFALVSTIVAIQAYAHPLKLWNKYAVNMTLMSGEKSRGVPLERWGEAARFERHFKIAALSTAIVSWVIVVALWIYFVRRKGAAVPQVNSSI